MKISAWHFEDVRLKSPNRRHTLSVVRLSEVAMGAPTSGELLVDGRVIGWGFGPSAIWSNDSKYFVIPKWYGRQQKLCLYDVEKGQLKEGRTIYRVLELSSLKDGLLKGVDSPIYETDYFSLRLKSEFQ